MGRSRKMMSVEAAPGINFTENQWKVLGYLADGKRQRDIAELLGTTDGGVRMRIQRMLNVTGCGTMCGLVAFALRNGVIK